MNALLNNLGLMMAPPAGAAGAGAEGGGQWVMLVMFGGIILIFYFLIIRPQRKRQKETDKMLKALKKNDKVVTIGGIHGTIKSVTDKTVILKIDDNVTMKFNRTAIHGLSAGSSEAAEEEDSKDSKENSKKK